MRLEIIDKDDLLGFDFGLWLIKKIQSEFIIKLDTAKLIPWDNFFENNPDYKSIYNQKISTLNILRFCLRTLTCDVVPGKIIIRIKRNQYVPGLDRVRATSILRLITFGNINIKGYSIFADILTDIAENINEYVKEFIGDFGYGGQIL